MENFNIAKWKKNFLNENTQEKYQVVFHDYSGVDIPYTDKFFDNEDDAEDFAISMEWPEDIEDYDGNFTTRSRYFNPQEASSEFGYHIEKVAV